MNLNVDFTSSFEKKRFEKDTGIHFGSIVNITNAVQKYALDNKLDGQVSVLAYQVGGDPSKLGDLLHKDANGTYYVISCGL